MGLYLPFPEGAVSEIINISLTQIYTDKCLALRPAQTVLCLPLQISTSYRATILQLSLSGGRQTADHATDSPASNPTEGPAYPSSLQVQILDYEGDIGT